MAKREPNPLGPEVPFPPKFLLKQFGVLRSKVRIETKTREHLNPSAQVETRTPQQQTWTSQSQEPTIPQSLCYVRTRRPVLRRCRGPPPGITSSPGNTVDAFSFLSSVPVRLLVVWVESRTPTVLVSTVVGPVAKRKRSRRRRPRPTPVPPVSLPHRPRRNTLISGVSTTLGELLSFRHGTVVHPPPYQLGKTFQTND